MLRPFQPIDHSIFTLHNHLEFLVCQVWCNACDTACADLLDADFEIAYKTYPWLKNSIDAIYEKCKNLTPAQRADIREAFNINNRIAELCNGTFSPIYLGQLPSIVEEDMKPLLIKFYTDLLDRAEIDGDKLDYYNKLIEKNNFSTCPCCGLSLIEPAENHYREDNDHFFPESKFPFASVNFQNLVPLCSKCNKKCKGTKNPVDSGRKAFYPFTNEYKEIKVLITIIDSDNLNYGKLRSDDIKINFDNNSEKTATWNWLYDIEDRYNYEVRNFSKTELRIMSNRLFKNRKRKHDLSYEEILNDVIEDYEIEKYEDRKFLKISFLEAMKNKPEWMAVYV